MDHHGSAQSSVTHSPALSLPNHQTSAILLLLLVLAICAWVAMAQVLTPPPVIPLNAPASQFSGERAFIHLRAIASEPHTVGSPAQARVRDYLVKEIQALGLTPVIQNATAALPGKSGVFASNLYNILVRIPGAGSTGAVAVLAHYDSQPNTNGASDNGTAVAGILETMRVIQAGPKPRNDLIFVLTDAEEVDAQGAEAFYRQHPWAKDIRVLVNFEAAGSSGTSLLLETSPGNRGLVEGFIQAVPHPVAYSFLTQLLSVMPLGTDMTVFSENGIPSLSPMFGWGYHVMYHSWLDNTAVIDRRSVQHQGENALGLARYFGDQDLGTLNTQEDQVFFTLFPGLTVQYPASWALPLTILAALALASAIVFGFLRRKLSILGILGGFASALALVFVPLILAAVAWVLIAGLHPEFWRNLMGAPYQAELYLLGLAALVTASSLALFVLLRRKVSLPHLTLGAALIWLVLALLTSLSLPGMSYLFTWPILLISLVLVLLLSQPDTQINPLRLVAMLLSGAASSLLVIPIIVLLFMVIGFWFLMMTPGTPFFLVPLLFLALLLSLLAPQMELLVQRRKWLAPGITALLSVGLLVYASLTSGITTSQPMQNGVWYLQDADNQKAAWYSFGDRPTDFWTAQFFPGKTETVDLSTIYPMLPGNPTPPSAFSGVAPVAELPAPELAVISDQTAGNVRTLKLHLSSPRLARGLLVKVSGAPVLAASVNGNRQSDSAWSGQDAWYLRYYGMTEQGLELQLDVQASKNLTLALTDQSDGLPDLAGINYKPRSSDMMPFALAQEYMPYPETTSISKTFQLQ